MSLFPPKTDKRVLLHMLDLSGLCETVSLAELFLAQGFDCRMVGQILVHIVFLRLVNEVIALEVAMHRCF